MNHAKTFTHIIYMTLALSFFLLFTRLRFHAHEVDFSINNGGGGDADGDSWCFSC